LALVRFNPFIAFPARLGVAELASGELVEVLPQFPPWASARESEIFAVAQFPTFSTKYADTGHSSRLGERVKTDPLLTFKIGP
jgi:hypothetical protein